MNTHLLHELLCHLKTQVNKKFKLNLIFKQALTEDNMKGYFFFIVYFILQILQKKKIPFLFNQIAL